MLQPVKTLTLPTNLHCQGCVKSITSAMDQDPNIHQWSVDLEPEVKTLTVTGPDVSESQVRSHLRASGYDVIKSQASGFWQDMHAWRRAAFNTTNCLIGCSIGDFGMVIFLQAFYPGTPLMTQMILAIIAGLITSIMLETVLLKYREHFHWSFALKTAFGMSFISMVMMEIAMTSTDFMITGGQAAFQDVWYWLALLPALIVGFIAPLPYNYYRLKKFNKACH